MYLIFMMYLVFIQLKVLQCSKLLVELKYS